MRRWEGRRLIIYLSSKRTYFPHIARMSLIRSPTSCHVLTGVSSVLAFVSGSARNGISATPRHWHGPEASVAASRPAVWSGRTTSWGSGEAQYSSTGVFTSRKGTCCLPHMRTGVFLGTAPMLRAMVVVVGRWEHGCVGGGGRG